MNIFPYRKSVIVLPLSAEMAEDLLKLSTTGSITYHDLLQERKKVTIEKFQGKVKDKEFTISKKVYYPQNYLPLIKGKIEATNHGCLILTEYGLFPGTKFLFYLWSFVMAVIALVFFLYKPNYLYASLASIFFILNYAVALANFNIHFKDSKKILEEVFEL